MSAYFSVFLLLQGMEGLWDGPPFEVAGDRTEFSLALFGLSNLLFYPLTVDQSYSVDVSICINHVILPTSRLF